MIFKIFLYNCLLTQKYLTLQISMWEEGATF